MKTPSLRPRRLLLDCGVILAVHFVLLHIMAHTRIVENVMAFQFNIGELLVILLFFLARFLAYFVVPAALAMLVAGSIFDRLARRRP